MLLQNALLGSRCESYITTAKKRRKLHWPALWVVVPSFNSTSLILVQAPGAVEYYNDLDSLLAVADVVALSLPLNAKTTGFFSATK